MSATSFLFRARALELASSKPNAHTQYEKLVVESDTYFCHFQDLQTPFDFFYDYRYRNSLVFVVRPFPECLCSDHIRLVPKMDELVEYTIKMEAILQENEIPYTLIDVLNLKERVEIVKQKIMEYKAFTVTRTNKNVFVRDDWVHCNL